MRLEAELKRRIEKREAETLLYRMYPDDGPLRRELYVKHLEFFAAGAYEHQRAVIGANRSGKSTATCYETTLHATGEYPNWWEGWRYNRPVSVWACGEDAKAVRESLQPTLLGYPKSPIGTGLIPRASIVGDPIKRSGVPDAIDSVNVRHISGGITRIVFKAYEQGRESFQAAQIDIGLCDEEPPHPVYSEILTRTMATVPGQANGHIMCGFTPLLGWSSVVMMYLGTGAVDTK